MNVGGWGGDTIQSHWELEAGLGVLPGLPGSRRNCIIFVVTAPKESLGRPFLHQHSAPIQPWVKVQNRKRVRFNQGTGFT